MWQLETTVTSVSLSCTTPWYGPQFTCDDSCLLFGGNQKSKFMGRHCVMFDSDWRRHVRTTYTSFWENCLCQKESWGNCTLSVELIDFKESYFQFPSTWASEICCEAKQWSPNAVWLFCSQAGGSYPFLALLVYTFKQITTLHKFRYKSQKKLFPKKQVEQNHWVAKDTILQPVPVSSTVLIKMQDSLELDCQSSLCGLWWWWKFPPRSALSDQISEFNTSFGSSEFVSNNK